MNIAEKYIELKKDLTKVKKQMVFDFSQHLFNHYAIILYIENNRLLIRTDNLKYNSINLIDFFEDEFKDYHYHASLLFELSEALSMTDRLEDFELGTSYFLNFIDIF